MPVSVVSIAPVPGPKLTAIIFAVGVWKIKEWFDYDEKE